MRTSYGKAVVAIRESDPQRQIESLVNDSPEDPRLPGFSPKERSAFVDLALSGLLDSDKPADGSSQSKKSAYEIYKHQAQILTCHFHPYEYCLGTTH